MKIHLISIIILVSFFTLFSLIILTPVWMMKYLILGAVAVIVYSVIYSCVENHYSTKKIIEENLREEKKLKNNGN